MLLTVQVFIIYGFSDVLVRSSTHGMIQKLNLSNENFVTTSMSCFFSKDLDQLVLNSPNNAFNKELVYNLMGKT